VADRWGNVVAATPSGNPPYATSPGGITHATRLSSLNTTKGHPNRIEPGKRPRITLTPTIVLMARKPVLAISVAGGDLQDQTTLNVLLNFVEAGMLPEDAVRAPRFSTGHHQDSFDPRPDRQAAFGTYASLQVDAAVREEVLQDLRLRGHEVKTTTKPIGHPVMIYIDASKGEIRAAGDPSAGRHAGALP
jgi:gamma-glutamyltranspeptidase/glutathione hydrolase